MKDLYSETVNICNARKYDNLARKLFLFDFRTVLRVLSFLAIMLTVWICKTDRFVRYAYSLSDSLSYSLSGVSAIYNTNIIRGRKDFRMFCV